MNQITNKKNILKKISLTSILFLVFTIDGVSAPFINITKIDSESSYPEIKIHVTISNINGQFQEIDESNLIAYEDGYKVNYKVSNTTETNDLFYLVFSIDSSKSISSSFLKSIKSSSKEILSTVGDNSKIAIYSFDDKVRQINTFISNKSELIKNINLIQTKGKKTLLYNSIYDSIDLLSNVKGKKRIIVFTDGKDEGSIVKVNDLIKFSRDFKIPVYFICLKTSKNIKTLARISKLTGGKLVYSNNSSNVSGMYKTLISVIKNKFLIQYKTSLKNDGNNHTAEVRFKYGVIRDRESKEFFLKNSKSDFLKNLKFDKINILLFFIGLLIILLTISLIITFNKNRFIKPNSDYPQISNIDKEKTYIEDLIKLEHSERLREENIQSSNSSEFSYPKAWLIEKNGPVSGKKFPLFWDETTIGRDKENAIVVEDKAVSMKHIKIKKVNNTYYLFDLISEHGTFLNNNKLLRPKILYDWDEFKIGRTHFIFRGSKLEE